ncbi:MAG: gliding-motility protein MglA [Myxococcales bacterium]|nr:gliding-motility protein MglA [Myxococcales bacterium]
MTLINYENREINFKIVYFGPAQVGKSDNLKYVYHRTPPEKRGELVLLSGEDGRTTFFDFLPLFLGKMGEFTARLHLYTLPGSLRLDTNRRLILKGVDGLVFVADSRRERLDENLAALDAMRRQLRECGYDFGRLPLVLQYNMRDFDSSLAPDDLSRILNPEAKPAFPANARTGHGVLETLKSVSLQVLSKLGEK